jgi:hypothetical protein
VNKHAKAGIGEPQSSGIGVFLGKSVQAEGD